MPGVPPPPPPPDPLLRDKMVILTICMVAFQANVNYLSGLPDVKWNELRP